MSFRMSAGLLFSYKIMPFSCLAECACRAHVACGSVYPVAIKSASWRTLPLCGVWTVGYSLLCTCPADTQLDGMRSA